VSTAFSQAVVSWYDRHGRKNLPWQGTNPYHVWLSEIMLQQTQVVKVLDYFQRFTDALPTLADLAAAEEQQVMALWSGLGYYNRARNLHRSARICVSEHQGRLPQSLDQLMALPGIGRSTAAAILSLAFGQPEPIMDGNVKRVFARHFKVAGDPNKSQTLKQLWQLAEAHREQHRPAAYTQGLMDLGATLCSKHNPRCDACPVSDSCLALAGDVVADYPQKKAPVKTREVQMHCLLVEQGGRLALQQRSGQGIWAKLWFLPTYESADALKAHSKGATECFTITHRLTHRLLQLHVYQGQADASAVEVDWVSRQQLVKWPHPKALIHILEQHDNH
jgi:A/G-specific adenine glycosylase